MPTPRNPSRATRHFALLLAALATLASTHFAAEPAAKKPNVLIIIADQWRAQAFGYAGDPNVKTPHIDRFERESVNFTQAVSGTPVCTPMRASMLTGQRPLTHGLFINDVPLRSEAVTIAEVLRDAGYATGCIGKWHVDGNGRSNFIPRERRQGFEYWKVLECTHAYNNSAYYADGPEKLKWEGYDAIAQTRDAQRYIETQAKSDKPFLLWLAWGPPHNPYETAPEKYRAMYDADKLQLRKNVPKEVEARTRKDLAGYYAHCTALDDCFHDLMETLRTSGIADNTIVVFTSDHGDMLGSHALIRKQKPYEESARVPMLFRLPAKLGIKPGRVDGTINTEDVMPTLLRLCEVKIPATVEGLDFRGYMRGEKDPSGGATVIQCASPFGEFTRAVGGKEYRAVRTKRYTYVRDLNGPWLFFDNEKDPFQLDNLVGKPEHAKQQEILDRELKLKLAQANDRFLPGADYIAKWGYKVNATGTMPYTP
jgi:arylsulfatase A-like enzyme